MPTISDLRKAGHSGGRLAMNLPSHCVADTIAKFIIVAMKPPGG
jgi:hypothetical protein